MVILTAVVILTAPAVVFMCQLYRVLFIILARVYYCCSFILFIVRLSFVLMSDFCYFSILLLFIYSLFIVQKKKIQFWSWIVFQVFWWTWTWTSWIWTWKRLDSFLCNIAESFQNLQISQWIWSQNGKILGGLSGG